MKNTNETFQLLSKLLTDKEVENTQITNLHEDIHNIVMQDLTKILNESTFLHKTSLLNEFIDLMTEMEILMQFPELIGKTIIGIVGLKGDVTSDIINIILKGQKSESYMNSKNIPSIIYRGSKNNKINIANILDSNVDLSVNDYNMTNNLYRQGLDIRQFIQVFSISVPIAYSNIVYVYFPFYALRSQEYYKNLIDLTDYLIIPLEADGSWKKSYDFYVNNKSDKNLLLIGEKVSIGQDDKIIGIELLDDWLESQNLAKNNITFYERFLWIISKFKKEQKARLDYQNDLIVSINENLIMLDDDETKESLKEYRVKIGELNKVESSIYNKFNKVSGELLILVSELSNKLLTLTRPKVDMELNSKKKLNKDHEDLIAKIVINLIEIEDSSMASFYIEKLKNKGYPYAYILDLYNYNQKKMTLPPKLLTRLKEDESYSDILYRAKIKFAIEIDLTIFQIGEYAKVLEEPLDGYENFQLGNYYLNKDINKAMSYYNKALEQGYQEAGKVLVYSSTSTFELKRLADKLIPEANYRYALACFKENKKKLAIINLRIAAAFGHEDAILELANIEYSVIRRNSRNLDERGMKSVNRALNLYKFLYKKNSSDLFYIERLGMIYYWVGDYRLAKGFLNKCDSPEALYTYGRIFQYGQNGIPQDLDRAKTLFKKASDKGHKKAQAEFEKVTGWIDDNSESVSYKSGNDYSIKTTDRYYSHSEACILTTATCLMLDKGDDCEELMEFRKYRDNHLIHDEDGPDLISEYYRIAPKILEKIYEEENFRQVFQKMYDEGIAVGYELLKKGEYSKAKEVYYKMVKKLSIIYSVK